MNTEPADRRGSGQPRLLLPVRGRAKQEPAIRLPGRRQWGSPAGFHWGEARDRVGARRSRFGALRPASERDWYVVDAGRWRAARAGECDPGAREASFSPKRGSRRGRCCPALGLSWSATSWAGDRAVVQPTAVGAVVTAAGALVGIVAQEVRTAVARRSHAPRAWRRWRAGSISSSSERTGCPLKSTMTSTRA